MKGSIREFRRLFRKSLVPFVVTFESEHDELGSLKRNDLHKLPESFGGQPDPAEIIIGKHRNGPTGTVELAYRPEFTAFDDLETAYVDPSESQQG